MGYEQKLCVPFPELALKERAIPLLRRIPSCLSKCICDEMSWKGHLGPQDASLVVAQVEVPSGQ